MIVGLEIGDTRLRQTTDRARAAFLICKLHCGTTLVKTGECASREREVTSGGNSHKAGGTYSPLAASSSLLVTWKNSPFW